MRRSLALGVGAALLIATAAAGEPAARHGLSTFGALNYAAGFAHFDYVAPDAPKGGALRMWALESYDSLNPFVLKGVPAAGVGLIYETLMTAADDEADAMYGLIAESAAMASDRSSVTFTLGPEARWSDGAPITAADVVFSFETLRAEGHPSYRVLYRDIARIEALAPDRVRFSFAPGEHRDLPLIAAGMPVLSEAYWSGRDFGATTLEPPVSSGPYRIETIDAGRSITYRRVADHWGRDLPVYRGRYNFDVIRFDYYRDRGIALEAFFAGEYDFREEYTSKSWATEYDKPPVRDGRVRRETLADETPSGVQAFFINTRRAKFADPRVREALNLAFDFEWTNENLFHGLYKRATSMFENSELAAKGPPSDAELALLEPWRADLPAALFEQGYMPPATDGSGHNRDNLREATRRLAEAGWRIVDGRAVDDAGSPFEIEFLMFENTFQRVVAPFVKNLERLGIDARMRIVDLANFQNRIDGFDYDIVVRRYVQPLTPGIEQRGMWGSAEADTRGGRNLSGVRDPIVDALIEAVVEAGSRAELVTAARALDRVLMWGYYVVPHWYKGSHNIAYWDKFDRPAIKPRYARGVIDTWWIAAGAASGD